MTWWTSLGWLSQAQLVDAIAVGQVTPGPLATTATFVGYLMGGVPAALLATLAMFLPGFLFAALTHPLLVKLRESGRARCFLDGVVFRRDGIDGRGHLASWRDCAGWTRSRLVLPWSHYSCSCAMNCPRPG